MTGDAEAAGEREIAVEVANPDRVAPGDGREEHLQLGIGQRSFLVARAWPRGPWLWRIVHWL
jgi:hypothetical protein